MCTRTALTAAPHRDAMPRVAIAALAVVVGAILAMALAAPALASSPRLVSTHTDWKVYARGSGREMICFALSEPTDAAPLSVDHGNTVFLVSTWKSGAAREQPSFVAGYDLRPGAPSQTRVGSSRFRMFVDGREAFIEDDDDEPSLVAQMRRGSTMRLETVSARGTATSYEFSLKGVTAALRAAATACA